MAENKGRGNKSGLSANASEILEGSIGNNAIKSNANSKEPTTLMSDAYKQGSDISFAPSAPPLILDDFERPKISSQAKTMVNAFRKHTESKGRTSSSSSKSTPTVSKEKETGRGL